MQNQLKMHLILWNDICFQLVLHVEPHAFSIGCARLSIKLNAFSARFAHVFYIEDDVHFQVEAHVVLWNDMHFQLKHACRSIERRANPAENVCCYI